MSSFLGACGATGPLRWTVECQGSTDGERLTFDRPFLVVGRDRKADLHLPHAEVSERHAYLQWVGGRLCCVDLGSRAGTYLDGRCRRSGWVDRGGTIRIGPYRLRLLSGGGEVGEGESPCRSLVLDLSHRSIRSSSCTVTDEVILVGSATVCQVRLLDPSVSNIHCALLQTPTGTWAVDLLGGGGLAINGTESRFGRIAEGDELRVGHSRVRLAPARRTDTAGEAGPPGVASPLPSSAPALVSAADMTPILSGLPPAQAELAEALLVPLARQFGMMQQQMFERIQQAERERFQALAAFQSEQFSVLREELEQLRELRQEIDEMRGERRAEGHSAAAHDRMGPASITRPRLGAATAPVARDASPQPLAAPEPPGVLRIKIGEAS